MYVKEIKRATYICTVPSGGPHAITCYPDAVTVIIDGKKYAYSERTLTMIVLLYSSAEEVKNAKEFFERITPSEWEGLKATGSQEEDIKNAE